MGPRNARDLHLDWAFNLIAPIIFSDGYVVILVNMVYAV